MPRDTVDVPLPPGPRPERVRGIYRGKINSLWYGRQRCGRPVPRQQQAQRGFKALKATLGNLYGLAHPLLRRGQLRRLQEGRRHPRRGHDQRPDPGHGRLLPGRRRPPPPDLHPGRDPAHDRRAGARVRPRRATRSSDFDRAASASSGCCCRSRSRSNVEHADPEVAGPRQGAPKSRSTRTSRSTSCRSCCRSRASVDTSNIRSYVFSPPLYGDRDRSRSQCGDSNEPLRHKIRQAVKRRLSGTRRRLSAEEKHRPTRARRVWVLNGSGQTGPPGGHIAAFLEYQGISASAPTRSRPRHRRRRRSSSTTGRRRRCAGDDRVPARTLFRMRVTPATDPQGHSRHGHHAGSRRPEPHHRPRRLTGPSRTASAVRGASRPPSGSARRGAMAGRSAHP